MDAQYTMEISAKRAIGYLLLVLTVVVLGEWHKNRVGRSSLIDRAVYSELIDRHRLQDATDLNGKTPIWIPIVHEPNARWWPSFGSRMTHDTNKPYLTLCVETLVKNAGDNYAVVVLDDTSYGRLIPGWNVELSTVAEPMRGYLRTLAQWKVLYYYGGVVCPPTTICLQSFDVLRALAKGSCFSVETPATALSDNLYQANAEFVGCDREDADIQQMIVALEKIVSSDATDAVAFNGDIQRIMADASANGKLVVLEGSVVGVKDEFGCPVSVDGLFEGVKLSSNLWGIVLPEKEISARIKYGWFQRLSPEQIMTSSVPFSVYYRWALQR